jgi:hypothetical protein
VILLTMGAVGPTNAYYLARNSPQSHDVSHSPIYGFSYSRTYLY